MSTSLAASNAAQRSVLFLISAGVLWGTGGLAGAALQAQTGWHPLAVAAYRLLLGGGLATLVLIRQVRRVPRTRAVIRRLLAAGALLALFQTMYFASVSLTSVSLATLITIGSVPVFVTLAGAVRERRRPGGRTVLSVGLAIVGLGLLAGTPTAASASQAAAGVTFSLVAGAGFATFTLINQHEVPGLAGGVVSAVGLLVGGLMLLPVALPLGMALPMTPEVLATAAFLGAVPTALAYCLYVVGLRRAHPVAAALAAMLEPLTATAFSVVFLDESLGFVGTAGALLLGTALLLYYARQSTED